MRLFVQILTFLAFDCAWAGLMLDTTFTTSQNTRVSATQTTSSKTFYSAGVLVNVDNQQRIYLGAFYLGFSSSESASSTTTNFSSQDIALGFRWHIDRAKMFSLSAGYGITATGTYSSGSTNETWAGTSLFAKFSMHYPVNNNFNAGVSLIYYQASYATRTSSSTQSNVAYSNTMTAPALGFVWGW